MACFHPIHGFRGVDGKFKTSRSGAYRDLPLTISCGQCSGCRLEYSRQWAVRATHEAQTCRADNKPTSFITLTYDDDNLPVDGSLDVSHWQLFAKRLRKKIGPFRFLHCGEYGEQTFRPHYHALIYGYDWIKDRKFWDRTKNGHSLYRSDSLEETWGKGMCPIGDLTFESAAYVARYAMKKQTGVLAKALYGWERKADKLIKSVAYKGKDRPSGELVEQWGYEYKPPYITMSRRPGLGARWLEKYKSDVYPCDEVIINGKQGRPPAYYDRLLERDDPKLHQTLKVRRRLAGSKHDDNNTYDRLAVRETVTNARISVLTRKI